MIGIQRYAMLSAVALCAGCGKANPPLTEGARIHVQIGEQTAEIALYDHDAAQALPAKKPRITQLRHPHKPKKALLSHKVPHFQSQWLCSAKPMGLKLKVNGIAPQSH